ncbi:hypothetical protein EYF80_003146 [Liparis tanakae]|uniref:Uncharacterized protein n=1 Tax=Liparis tanakae TaxID=230148 RepID=A0A4Z2JAH9_9TELE|nr:hypothetical protein EYF80_003146 [Liparis tanakae]
MGQAGEQLVVKTRIAMATLALGVATVPMTYDTPSYAKSNIITACEKHETRLHEDTRDTANACFRSQVTGTEEQGGRVVFSCSHFDSKVVRKLEEQSLRAMMCNKKTRNSSHNITPSEPHDGVQKQPKEPKTNPNQAKVTYRETQTALE